MDCPSPLQKLQYGPALNDELLYDDRLPWGVASDGLGQSLHRRSGLSYGSFATAWTTLAPTPGSASLTPAVSGDLNGDGILGGSDIDLVVDARESDSHDSFQWNLNIRVRSQEKTVAGERQLVTRNWNSKKDFRGPNIRFSRWAQYVQALLLTNEFMFVD